MTISAKVGDLTNLQLHSNFLSDAQMSAITLCEEHVEGDMVVLSNNLSAIFI